MQGADEVKNEVWVLGKTSIFQGRRKAKDFNRHLTAEVRHLTRDPDVHAFAWKHQTMVVMKKKSVNQVL